MNESNLDFERFLAATDEVRMLELFASRLPEKIGGRVSVESLWIPRVAPLRSLEYAIQFRLKISGDRPDDNLILWGKLAETDRPRSAEPHTCDPRVIEFEELGLVVPVFPYDPKLPLLETVWNSTESQPAMIAGESENGEELSFFPREVLGYRLERRCTLLGEMRKKSGANSLESRDAVIKLLRPHAAAGLIKSYKFLESSGLKYDAQDGITVPHLLFTDEKAGIIITETVADPSLHDLENPARFISACSDAGRALRRLHSLDPTDLPTFTLTDELSMLRRNSTLAARIYPDLSESFVMAIEALGANLTEIDPSGFVVSHRDFFDKQILVSDERVTLLDFDTLALADPALDVGNFLAHLFLRGLQNSELRGRIEKGSDSFTGAYTSGGGSLPHSVRWWRAATLVRLAGLYSLRPRWRQIAPELLDQAVREMDNVVH